MADQRLEHVENIVNEIKGDITLIKQALLGNPLGGDGGLVGKVDKIEIRQNHLDQEMRLLRDERVRNTVYIKIITWLLCIVGVAVIGFVINTALAKPPVQIIDKTSQNHERGTAKE